MAKKKEYTFIDELLDAELFLDVAQESFACVEDPRSSDNCTYPLFQILFMSFAAVIGGANTIGAIHQYLEVKEALFQELLGIERTPCYATLWWLMTRVNPGQLVQAMKNWAERLPHEAREKLIAIDGKRLRAASVKNEVHIVEAWDSVRGLVLAQNKTESKSNEITAIPELLDLIDVKEATITIDAAGCQKTIVQKIVEKEGHYVIALKGNQGMLQAEAINFFEQARQVEYEHVPCDRYSQTEKGHGRIEEREITITTDLSWLDNKEDWKGLGSFIEVVSRRTVKGKTTEEKRYYISDRKMRAEQAGSIIRKHWDIENGLHWIMDMTFQEDLSTANIGHAAENLSILRRMAINLFKGKAKKGAGVTAKRRKAAWDDHYMVELFAQFILEPELAM
ncbi:MAG TPA: ISAs1 family transposase [Chitinophagaceae bacterium]|nr:ISAs1 family transposase [Chitinophagaceae bacterium]